MSRPSKFRDISEADKKSTISPKMKNQKGKVSKTFFIGLLCYIISRSVVFKLCAAILNYKSYFIIVLLS